MTTFRFGYLPDKLDGRDKPFKLHMGDAPRASEATRMLGLAGPVRDQGNTGSCVGQSCAEAVQVRRRLDGGPAHEQLSALALYWHARAVDGPVDEDGGTYIRNAIRVARNVGVCSQDSWPFDERRVNERPPMMAEIEGLASFEGNYERISEQGVWRAERVLDALQSSSPVVFGTQVTSLFMMHRGDSVLAAPKPDEPRVGGHAVLALAFKDHGRAVWIRNSWGTSWGSHGGAWISSDWLADPETQDAWTLRPKQVTT